MLKTSRDSFYKGVELTLLSSLSLSLIGLIAKLGIADLTIPALLFWRFFSAFVLYFFLLLITRKLAGALHFGETRSQVIRVIFMLTSQYCFFYYLQNNSLLNASALLNTGPIFLALIEWKILGEKVGISTWIGCAVAFCGALLILQPDVGIFSFMSLIGLFSGVTQGASQAVFSRSVHESRLHINLLHLFGICTLVTSIPFLFFPIEYPDAKSFMQIDILWVVLLGTGSVINQLCRAGAYRFASPSRVAPFLYFSVLFAGVWDWLAFGRIPNTISLIGTGLIVVGGMLKIIIRKWVLHRQKRL